MMDLSDGVMLLGESYGGKTKALKILAASLQAAEGTNGKAPSQIILNPKAMKIDQLYGWFDADEWKDGILATNFRHFDSLPEHVSYIEIKAFFLYDESQIVELNIYIGHKTK